MPRRILQTVYNRGYMPGAHHYVRSRLVPTEGLKPYDDQGNRMTSSIHSIINWRAGLGADMRPVEARPGDVLPPYRGVRKHPQDPTRLH